MNAKFPEALPRLVAVALCAGCGVGGGWQPAPVGELPLDVDLPQIADDMVRFVPSLDDVRDSQLLFDEAATSILYVNFSDGTTVLTKGKEDAMLNTSSLCGTTPNAYPAFGGSDSEKRAFIAALAGAMSDFNLIVVTTRPTGGTYSMEMVGPQGFGCTLAGAVGVAPLDCGNRSHQNISFNFGNSWITSAQESGHTFGLSHNDVECDVMGYSYSGKGCPSGAWGYPDVDGVVISRGVTCGATTQNSYRLMATNLGMWPGGPKPDPWIWSGDCFDNEDPVIKWREPNDGQMVAANFDVRLFVTDDCTLANVHLSVTPAGLQSDLDAAPFSWVVSNVNGPQTITITATDKSGRITVSSRTVTAPGGVSDDAGTGGAGGGDATNADASGDGAGGAGHPTEDGGPTEAAGDTLEIRGDGAEALADGRGGDRPGGSDSGAETGGSEGGDGKGGCQVALGAPTANHPSVALGLATIFTLTRRRHRRSMKSPISS